MKDIKDCFMLRHKITFLCLQNGHTFVKKNKTYFKVTDMSSITFCLDYSYIYLTLLGILRTKVWPFMIVFVCSTSLTLGIVQSF